MRSRTSDAPAGAQRNSPPGCGHCSGLDGVRRCGRCVMAPAPVFAAAVGVAVNPTPGRQPGFPHRAVGQAGKLLHQLNLTWAQRWLRELVPRQPRDVSLFPELPSEHPGETRSAD